MDAGETGVDIFRAFAGLGLTKSTTSCPKREENDLGVIGAGRSPYTRDNRPGQVGLVVLLSAQSTAEAHKRCDLRQFTPGVWTLLQGG